MAAEDVDEQAEEEATDEVEETEAEESGDEQAEEEAPTLPKVVNERPGPIAVRGHEGVAGKSDAEVSPGTAHVYEQDFGDDEQVRVLRGEELEEYEEAGGVATIKDNAPEPGPYQPDDHEDEGVQSTAEARELANEETVDLARVDGSGEDGVVTKSDVQEYIDERPTIEKASDDDESGEEAESDDTQSDDTSEDESGGESDLDNADIDELVEFHHATLKSMIADGELDGRLDELEDAEERDSVLEAIGDRKEAL